MVELTEIGSAADDAHHGRACSCPLFAGPRTDDLESSIGFVREVGDSGDGRELLKDTERVVHDDVDADSAEAHDSVVRVPSSP